MLRRIFVLLLSSFFLFCAPITSFADQLVPPTPNWWPDGGYDLRHGVWIACNNDIWAKDDCIESIEVKPIAGGDWQPMTLVPNPAFSPEVTTQIRGNGEGNDYSYLANPYGTWMPPTGLKVSSDGGGVSTDLGFFGVVLDGGSSASWMSFDLAGQFWNVSLLSSNQFRVTIRSAALSAYARWTYSGSADANFDWTVPGKLIYTASPSTVYYPPTGTWNDTCAGKIVHPSATDQISKSSFRISMWNNKKNDQPASEFISKTNGLMCMGSVTFDPQKNEISILLGNVEYDTNNMPIVGWMDSAIASRLLTSWWHIDPSKTGGQVQVQVTYSDGKREAVATTASYDKNSDSLQVHSSGFHYPLAQISIRVIPMATTTSANNTTSSNTSGGQASGAFVDKNGVWSTVDETFTSDVQLKYLNKGQHGVSVNFGKDYAAKTYDLSIVETLKGKKTYTKIQGLKLDVQGKGSTVLKNKLVPGSVLLATSGNRIATATVTR